MGESAVHKSRIEVVRQFFMRQIGLPVRAQQLAVENSLDSAQL